MVSTTFPPRRRDARVSVGLSILAGVVAVLGAMQFATASSAAPAEGSNWASRTDSGQPS